MKTRIVTVMTAAILCCAAVGCNPQTYPAGSLHLLGMEDNDTDVTAAEHDRIMLVLPVDANEDYSWQMTSGNEDILYTLDERPTSQLGRPGVYVVTFYVRQAGWTLLKFEYRPSGGGAATSIFTVHVHAP
jgi:predicted secreted protein